MLQNKIVGNIKNTDTSIEEENEPCELHEQLNCNICEREVNLKDNIGSTSKDNLEQVKEVRYIKYRHHLNTSNNSNILKRSISSNAVNNVKRRTSVPLSFTNLHRTLSQTSCYSTGSTRSVPIELQEESFHEFFNYVTGEDQYNKVNNLWEILPKETKDVFIKRVLAKKKKLNNDRKLVYNDLRNVLTMKDDFNLFGGNEESYPINISNKISNNRQAYKVSNNINNRVNKESSYSFQREQIISQIIGEIFEEVSKREIQHLRNEESVCNQSKESPALQKTSNNKEKNLARNIQAGAKRKPLLKEQSELLLLEDNTTLEEIRLWRDRQEINDRINELNRLIERYEQLSPLHTPVSSNINDKANEGDRAQKQIKNTTAKENSCTIFDIFTTKSKKFIGIFKHKKKTSKFDLYRKPNPNVQQIIVEPKEVKKT